MVDYFLVATFGVLVGLSELLTGYRERASMALRTPGAVLYLAVNAAASIAALAIIREFDWKFGLETDGQVATAQLLAAGFGAMAFLRSSVFIVRVGNQNVPIGPGFFLTSLADFAQYGVTNVVQRRVTKARAELARLTAKGWDFEDAQSVLPVYCLALAWEPVDPSDQTMLAVEVERLRDSPLPDYLKTLLLGLTLQKLVGEEIFSMAVLTYGDEMRRVSEHPDRGHALGDAVQRLAEERRGSNPTPEAAVTREAAGQAASQGQSQTGTSGVD